MSEKSVKMICDAIVVGSISMAVTAVCKATRSGWPMLALGLIPIMKSAVQVNDQMNTVVNNCSCSCGGENKEECK